MAKSKTANKKPKKSTPATVAENRLFYAVLRLNESVEVRDYRDEPCQIQVTNDEVAGYLPVYRTVEAAQKSSQDGKYSIVAIQSIA